MVADPNRKDSTAGDRQPTPGFRAPRGYFGVGVETISKVGNLGNLIRSANAFGAAFVFTVSSDVKKRDLYRVDTSKSFDALPFYSFDKIDDILLPEKVTRVGIELTDEAIELPSFRHPLRAAYLFGPERGSLSPELQDTCDFIVKIPTRFCINIATAAAVVFYDRHVSLGRFAERAVSQGAPEAKLDSHVQGGPVLRLERRAAAKLKSNES